MSLRPNEGEVKTSCLLSARSLGVKRILNRLCEGDRFALSPVMQEQNARLLTAHALVNGDNVDAFLAHGLEGAFAEYEKARLVS